MADDNEANKIQGSPPPPTTTKSSWIPWRRASAPLVLVEDKTLAPAVHSPPDSPKHSSTFSMPRQPSKTESIPSPPEVLSPRSAQFKILLDVLGQEIQLAEGKDLVQLLSIVHESDSSLKPDAVFVNLLLTRLSTLRQEETVPLTRARLFLDNFAFAPMDKSLQHVELSAAVLLLVSVSRQVRVVSYHFLSHVYALDRPWTLAQYWKRTQVLDAFLQTGNACSVEWCECLELFLQSSLLNSSEPVMDTALERFDQEGGYEMIIAQIESDQTTTEVGNALIDLLRGLTFLGGPPPEFQEAYLQSKSENKADAISEAKNLEAFTGVARLVNKMLERTSGGPSTLRRLPLLHAVMHIFEANPRNFGILERRFHLLKTLSTLVGMPNPHDELLFMCVKLFELVGLGFEYRPVTAVSTLCDSSLVPIAIRGDERTFAVLCNTLSKLCSRHPSLLLDTGLLTTVLVPLLSNPSLSMSMHISCLNTLAKCLEMHATNCSAAAKNSGVFQANCLLAKQNQVDKLCKRFIMMTDSDPVAVETCVQILVSMSLQPDCDIHVMMEVIQESKDVAFRTKLLQHCHRHTSFFPMQQQQHKNEGVFDCVLTVLLSLESGFTPDADASDKLALLEASLLFLSCATMVDSAAGEEAFSRLFSGIQLSNVLLMESTRKRFVDFVLTKLVLDEFQTVIVHISPLLLLGCFAPVGEEHHRLYALQRLRDLIANDGEASLFNRIQLAKFRASERLVALYSHGLVDSRHVLHEPLIILVGCVGNTFCSPELLDGLLRSVYRHTSGDDDFRPHIAAPPSISPTAAATSSVATEGVGEEKSEEGLTHLLELLRLVSEPKLIGNHVVLGHSPSDPSYTCNHVMLPLSKRIPSWPPSDVGYSVSLWFFLTLECKRVELVSILSNTVQVLNISLEVTQREDEEEDAMMMSSERSLSISTCANHVKVNLGDDLVAGRWHHLVLVHHRRKQVDSSGVAGDAAAATTAGVTTKSTSSTNSSGLGALFWSQNKPQGTLLGQQLDVFLNGASKQVNVHFPYPPSVTENTFQVRLGGEESCARFRVGPTLIFDGCFTSAAQLFFFLKGPNEEAGGGMLGENPVFEDKHAMTISALERVFLCSERDVFSSPLLTGWKETYALIDHALHSGSYVSSKLSLVFHLDVKQSPSTARVILPCALQETCRSLGGASCIFFPLLLRLGNRVWLCTDVLQVMKNALRGSDRARFQFNKEDGSRCLAYVMQLISSKHQLNAEAELEMFKSSLSLASMGNGFETWLVDPDAFSLLALNKLVWKHFAVLVHSCLVPFLEKLLSTYNANQKLNFAQLHTIHFVETWLCGLLESYSLEAVGVLEQCLRIDMSFTSLVFPFLLHTLSVSTRERHHELRHELLSMLIRLRHVSDKRKQTEGSVQDQQKQWSALFIQHLTGEWLGAMLMQVQEDLTTLQLLFAVMENEFLHDSEFKHSFSGASFVSLADTLGSTKFSSSPEVILFFLRLCCGCINNGSAAVVVPANVSLPLLMHQLVEAPKFGTFPSLPDVLFASHAFEGLLAWIRLQPPLQQEVVNHVFSFLILCVHTSPGLAKLWATSSCLRVLIRLIFTHYSPPCFALLVALIKNGLRPEEVYLLAANGFPEDAKPAVVLQYQHDLFLAIETFAKEHHALAEVIVKRACTGWLVGLEVKSLLLCFSLANTSLARTLSLCLLDRSTPFDNAVDQVLFKTLDDHLPLLFPRQYSTDMGADALLFCACFIRCIFPFAYEQADVAFQSLDTMGEEEPAACWTLFIHTCRLFPEGVKKLFLVPSHDADVIQSQQNALSGLNANTKMEWILEHFSPMKPLRNVFMVSYTQCWQREHKRWIPANRVPFGSDLHTLMEDVISSHATPTTSTFRSLVSGWTTSSTSSSHHNHNSSSNASRGANEMFFPAQAKSHQHLLKATALVMEWIQKLQSTRVEDLYQGEKAWKRILRRATLPVGVWEPFGGRRWELEEQALRWKLDPFEDPFRQRRRLRLNLTFYKRYHLQPAPAPSQPPLPSSTPKTKESPRASSTSPGYRKRGASQVGAGGMASPIRSKSSPPHVLFDPEIPASPIILQALRSDRLRSLTLNEDVEANEQAGSSSSPTSSGSSSSESSDSNSESEEEEEENDQELPVNKPVTTTVTSNTVFVSDPRERVKVELDAGDRSAITLFVNCSTARGLEERNGVCVLAKHALYVLDKYRVKPSGELVEEEDEDEQARLKRFSVQVRNLDESILKGVGGEEESNNSALLSEEVVRILHGRRRVRFEDMLDVFRRRFLFRDVALEIFSTDGATLLMVFATTKDRDKVQSEIKKARKRTVLDLPFPTTSSSVQTTSSSRRNLSRLSSSEAKRQWLQGQISNFDYLILLNTLAGRSYNDPAQYLVFPWVLKDYTSLKLDLHDAQSFRDFSKPMGAMTPERVASAQERYAQLDGEVETRKLPAFHFGVHYSCSGYVANLLFRLEPFSRMALQLQGGSFDLPDRLFRSIEQTWLSASCSAMQDVRELVPEFFVMHEFLENSNRFELGSTHRGVVVNDVELPRWCRHDPKEFIRLHRKALESAHVSEHLSEWIDLIFGYKQRGREAIKAVNVFHPLTYEGEVDLDAITDPHERASTMEQIHSFGQTPKRLFETHPHPSRKLEATVMFAPPLVVPGTMDRCSSPGLRTLVASNEVFTTSLVPGDLSLVDIDDILTVALPQWMGTGLGVSQLKFEDEKLFLLRGRGSTVFVAGNRYVVLNGEGGIHIHMGDLVLATFAGLHRGGVISCALAVEEGKYLVTGGADHLMCVWRLRKHTHQNPSQALNQFRLELEAENVIGCAVSCLTVDKDQGFILVGGKNGSISVWDWNKRQEFIRRVWHHTVRAVKFLGINSLNGNFASVCDREIKFWHINGDLLTSCEYTKMQLTMATSVLVTPCPSYQSCGIVMVLGHSNGDISLWALSYPSENDQGVTRLELRGRISEFSEAVVSLCLSKDGRTLVACNDRGEVKRFMSQEHVQRKFYFQQQQGRPLGLQTMHALVTRNSSLLSAGPATPTTTASATTVDLA